MFDSQSSVDHRGPPPAQLRLGVHEGTATIFTCLELVEGPGAPQVIVLLWTEPFHPIVRFDRVTGLLWLVAGPEIAGFVPGADALACRVRLEDRIIALLPADADLIAITDLTVTRVTPECRVAWSTATEGRILQWHIADGHLRLDVEDVGLVVVSLDGPA